MLTTSETKMDVAVNVMQKERDLLHTFQMYMLMHTNGNNCNSFQLAELN